jgi:uncharacterized protein YjiS (DUF1127 family)
MMTYRPVTVSMRIEHHVSALLAHGRATLHTWQHRRQTRHDLRSLLRLDDWMLADLGYNRWEVAEETRRPFWQPLAPHFVAGEIPYARQ